MAKLAGHLVKFPRSLHVFLNSQSLFVAQPVEAGNSETVQYSSWAHLRQIENPSRVIVICTQNKVLDRFAEVPNHHAINSQLILQLTHNLCQLTNRRVNGSVFLLVSRLFLLGLLTSWLRCRCSGFGLVVDIVHTPTCIRPWDFEESFVLFVARIEKVLEIFEFTID